MPSTKKGKDNADKSSTSEDRKKHEQTLNAVKCNICFLTFPKAVADVELQSHLDNKHAKLNKTIAEAFPDKK